MSLATYEKKRDFKRTKEPPRMKKAGKRKQETPLLFVVQKHDASRLHYDFRLEMGGVLKSWAVPKGPSLDPAVKRLAVEVEDHPYDYKDFEGEIPKGNYGAGDVIVWDRGLYASAKPGEGEEGLLKDLAEGHLSFVLLGEKLKGEFGLIRTRRENKEGERKQWLLIKANDQFASHEDITLKEQSVISKRILPRDR